MIMSNLAIFQTCKIKYFSEHPKMAASWRCRTMASQKSLTNEFISRQKCGPALRTLLNGTLPQVFLIF